jgi:uncharacterized radical SAM superfamily Fe-S cluster-containing enzyme
MFIEIKKMTTYLCPICKKECVATLTDGYYIFYKCPEHGIMYTAPEKK